MRKPTFALTGLAVLLSALALAAPAHATEVKAVCVVNGEAKTWDKNDPTLGVRLVGGKGYYTFHSLGLFCVGVKDGVPGVHSLSTRAEGVYETIVCGTGKTTGTITSLVGPFKYQMLIVGKKFTLHFIGLIGTFFWHDSDAPSLLNFKAELSHFTELNGRGGKPSDYKVWEAAGPARLDGPTRKEGDPPPDPSRNHCVKTFTVTTVVVIDEDDGQGPVPKSPVGL